MLRDMSLSGCDSCFTRVQLIACLRVIPCPPCSSTVCLPQRGGAWSCRRVGSRRPSRIALAALCETYWYPLYAYVRPASERCQRSSRPDAGVLLRTAGEELRRVGHSRAREVSGLADHGVQTLSVEGMGEGQGSKTRRRTTPHLARFRCGRLESEIEPVERRSRPNSSTISNGRSRCSARSWTGCRVSSNNQASRHSSKHSKAFSLVTMRERRTPTRLPRSTCRKKPPARLPRGMRRSVSRTAQGGDRPNRLRSR